MNTTVKFYETADDSLLKFAVIVAKSNGKWVFCKHKERDTYECPGGHREAGENIDDTAKRELYEETGAIDYTIQPVCVYSVTAPDNFDGKETYGNLYYAEIKSFEGELHSEIERVELFDELPTNWTYPEIQPLLLKKLKKVYYTVHQMNLNPEPFDLIRSGQKTIELRLNDEKRRLIKVGDRIEFTHTETGEKLVAEAIALHRFDSFAALYRELPLLKCGYTAADIATAKPEDMDLYYTPEQQRKYGVLGIEIKVINIQT